MRDTIPSGIGSLLPSVIASHVRRSITSGADAAHAFPATRVNTGLGTDSGEERTNPYFVPQPRRRRRDDIEVLRYRAGQYDRPLRGSPSRAVRVCPTPGPRRPAECID